ncbi:MAG: protein-L-isoaspartate(D-aspartate) O-methyltransferase [Acidimicrobiales bacterium]|nr:protein-L-isoaspartate(D-aspartate) O-methyltransferase [Acidimicrobiales bacterium]
MERPALPLTRVLLLSAAVVATTCGSVATGPVSTDQSTSTTGPVSTDQSTSTTETAQAPASTEEVVQQHERLVEREAMVDDQIASRGIDDPVVLEAMRAVPRHRFVPDAYDDQAYDDHPLPIGHGQTISQPYIVALMSQFLGVQPGGRVLEIGTGSGYQAAVLAEMGLEVFTIEIVEALADRATAALADAGYADVRTRQADGYFGWEDEAPFDAVIVTAAPDHVPQPLVEQLAPGARMVIPIGPVGAVQTLWMFTRDESGELLAESLGAVRFVPFTRTG